MHLVTTWFGSFLLEDGKVVQARPFPKEPEAIASRLAVVDDWKVLDEERDLMRGLDEVFVLEPRLERAGGNLVREIPPFLKPEDFGFSRDLLHAAMLALARRQMRKAVGPDDYAAQAVAALDDLTEVSNQLLERLREWYGLHFPELAKTVDDGRFLDLVAEHGDRAAMPFEGAESVGGPLSPEDREAIMGFAALARDVARRRRTLEVHLEARMRELAPNVSHLTGPILGARLIALAGGLEPLARLPASTVQLLGAERALFRHLREGTRPPKHGVLFQHPTIRRSPRWQRGALSRAFAGKIAIAARADAYTKRFIADALKVDLEKAIAEAKRTHASPPPRRAEPPRKRVRRRR
ncbi:MAG TPA: ribosomal biogenesis protein [Thermoplasmata archaeon]|jgi:nucleolar protein 56|nr:ribosomal biogenesis protein [Thermoplasmata archaeon]